MQVSEVGEDVRATHWYVKYQKLSCGVWSVQEKGVVYPQPVTIETVMADWPRAICWPMGQ